MQALPLILLGGAVGGYFLWRFMKSEDGKQLRQKYEQVRKEVAPGAPSVGKVLDMEPDPEVQASYKAMDQELSEFDRRLRRERERGRQ